MSGRAHHNETPSRAWPRRLLWFVGLWLFGVAALTAVAYLLRLAMGL